VKCPKCSSVNPDTQHFCGECGIQLILAKDSAESQTETLLLPALDLTSGSTFAGRYQIIDELGKGGMGRVYRVLDKKLGEEIAVKLIRPEVASDGVTLERFRTELKAARQIVHRNVARMFDLNEEKGVPYITMEYVKGENLRRLIKKMGRLSPEQAVPIARQVGEGLAEAHRLGVLHRDLKPQNVMIDEEGKARIMDFGLARFLKSDGTTETGVVIGTPAYISPELVEGLETDGRSDLYSLGVVLYEMVTGKTPFQSESGLSLALKHVVEMPKDPREINAEIPEVLSRIILKCLEKNREIRYQTAEELITDLNLVENELKTKEILKPMKKLKWRRARKRALDLRIPQFFIVLAVLAIAGYIIYAQFLRPGGLSWKKTIAVLPVQDLSPQSIMGNLCYGLQYDLIMKLQSISGLRSLPMLSVENYDYSGKSTREIGEELGADYLLRSTLQLEGDRIRVDVDLTDAKREEIAFQPYFYEGDMKSLRFFSIQDQISRGISRALKADLDENLLSAIKKTREPRNIDAYIHYLDGYILIDHVYRNTLLQEDFEKAIGNYEEALKIDPDYSLVYWGLGDAYEALYHSSRDKDPEILEKMIAYYSKAHDINADLAQTNLGLGWAYFNREDNARAFQYFRRALELDPENVVVNTDVGAFFRSIGLYKKAIYFFSRAVKLDPLYFSPYLQIAYCHLCLGEFKRALYEINKAIEKHPEYFSARNYSIILLIMTGRLNEAEKEIEIAQKVLTDRSILPSIQALLWAAKGERGKALDTLASIDQNEKTRPNVTWLYLILGMNAEAVRNIEDGIEKGFELFGEYLYSYPTLAKNPIYKELKDEPRFQEILKKEKAKYDEKLNKFGKM
jgi:tetratricopeptide (TPR) repeat protein